MISRSILAAGLTVWAGVAASAVNADDSRVLANLLKLHGDDVQVLYSAGALDRASHVQERLSAIARDVRDWSGLDLQVQGLVLSPDDWESLHLAAPYGMPQTMAQGVAVPAWGDERSVALWERLIGKPLPWNQGEPLRGSKEEAASLALADTMLQVEIGRMAAERAVPLAGPEWVGELLAHVVASSAMAVHEEVRAGEIDALYDALAQHVTPPAGVEAFSARADLEQRLAYQPLFHRGARIVLAKDGRKAARTLLKLPMGHGGQLTQAELLKRYPDLGAWLRGTAPAAH